MKKYAVFILALTFVGSVLLTGCNTVRGMGRDIEKGGKGLQNLSTK